MRRGPAGDGEVGKLTLAIGGILVLVFLVFAGLMCVERLSVLLALPLMSVTFLAIALTADLIQPSVVVHLETADQAGAGGAARRGLIETTGPSRFQAWKQQNLRQRQILAEKAAFLDEALRRLESAVGELSSAGRQVPSLTEGVRREFEGISDGERHLSQAAAEGVGAGPDPMARPPFYAGPRSTFEQAYGSFVLSERLDPLRAVLESGKSTRDIHRAQKILEGLRTEVDQFRARYGQAPAAESWSFRVLSGLGYIGEYLVLTLRAGSLSLYAPIIATIFGGMFATYIKNLRIAERMVYWTAEFAGERPAVICAAILGVTAIVFTSSGGLGTVIMVGTIVLPILRAVGVGPVVGAGVFLIGIAMGGTLYPATRRLWLDFYGLPADRLDSILWTMVGVYAGLGALWIAWGTRRRMLSNFHSAPAGVVLARPEVPARLMIAPLVPVALVYLIGTEEITAFIAAMAYMFVCMMRRSGAVRGLSRSMVEGAQIVMPPILLMLGIGILRTALSTDPVQGYLTPLLAKVTPDSRWSYILTFALAAPLALYRGPLNVWGMGLAVAATLLATSSLSPAAILCALLATGMLQSVCDPTNTQNVWVAGFQGVTVNQLLRHTAPLVWVVAAAAVTLFAFRYVGN